MGKIFQYDDEKPISFALTPPSAMVAGAIESHGGKITSVLDAFFEVYTARLPYTHPNVASPHRIVMVDATWIEESISAKTITPIYPHVLSKSSEPLQSLKFGDRDIAELIKAMFESGGLKKTAYKNLHEKYPHKSRQKWGELHENYKLRITKSVGLVETRIKNQLDASLRRLLAEAPSTMRTITPGAEEDSFSNVTLSSSIFAPHLPQAGPGLAIHQNAEFSLPVSRRKGGVPVTGKDIELLISFLVQRQLLEPGAGTMTTRDWEYFKEKYDIQNVRSINGWRGALRSRYEEVMKVVNKRCRKMHSV